VFITKNVLSLSGSQASSVLHLAEKPSSSQGKKELLTLQALPLKKRKKLLRGVRKELREEILRRQVEEKPLSKSVCKELQLPFVLGICLILPLYLVLKFVITVLVFWAKIKKNATLYGDPQYWCLNIFSHISVSRIICFNIISSIHNSNMEYQSLFQRCAGHTRARCDNSRTNVPPKLRSGTSLFLDEYHVGTQEFAIRVRTFSF
jgi:hypothetical protein